MAGIPTQEELAKMTPMMRQYYGLKAECKDAVLFFRMGDFYEIFGEDAENMAPLLDIVLTARERGDKKKIPFCGVPHHSVKPYWIKLLQSGYKVAIADQVEDPSTAKGIVKRAIVKTMTPGCIEDLEGLDSNSANYILAVTEVPSSRKWNCLAADISTGEMRLATLETKDEVFAQIHLFRPKELLVRRFLYKKLMEETSHLQSELGFQLEVLDEGSLQDVSAAKKRVKEHFGQLAKQPCGKVEEGEILVHGFFTHLESLKASTNQFPRIIPLKDRETFTLNETALRDLEIFETARRRSRKGSLLSAIDFTKTSMGSRLLKWNLSRPLLKKNLIEKRLDLVEAMVTAGEQSLETLRASLKQAPDLGRLATRIVSQKASPLELQKSKLALNEAMRLAKLLESFHDQKKVLQPLAKKLLLASPILDQLEQALLENPGSLGKGNEIFNPSYNPKLAELIKLFTEGEDQISAYQDSLRERTGITSLKVKTHKTFGLLLEVTKSNLNKVPDDFIRRQTMVNCERFVTPELKELEETLVEAQDKAIAMEQVLFIELLENLAAHFDPMQEISASLAVIDVSASYAYLATHYQFKRPKIQTQSGIDLKGCRHPVIEQAIGRERYVPNDIKVERKQCQLLITGPNMAGKSTIMRQVAVVALITQSGGYVPTASATLPIFDQVFTRVGASDDLAAGQSTFMVEMAEAAQILRNCTKNSLVILDEVGRGTSTTDGLAIAQAILTHLAKECGAWAFFATHYHELAELEKVLPCVRNVQTEVQRTASGPRFTHRLVEGASGSSFGIEVAKLAGLPNEVIQSAERNLQTITSENSPMDRPTKRIATNLRGNNGGEVLARLESLRINRLSPLQALNQLHEFQELLLKASAPQEPPSGLFASEDPLTLN